MPGFNPRWVNIGFMVDRVILGLFFSTRTPSIPCPHYSSNAPGKFFNISPTLCHLSSCQRRLNNTSLKICITCNRVLSPQVFPPPPRWNNLNIVNYWKMKICINLVTSGRQSAERIIFVYVKQLPHNSADGTFSQKFVYRIQEVQCRQIHKRVDWSVHVFIW